MKKQRITSEDTSWAGDGDLLSSTQVGIVYRFLS